LKIAYSTARIGSLHFGQRGSVTLTGAITTGPCGSCGPVTWNFVGSGGGVVSSAYSNASMTAVNSPLTFTATAVYFEPDINAGSIHFAGGTASLTFTGGQGSPANDIIYANDAGSPPTGASQVFTGAVPDGQPALTLGVVDPPMGVPMQEPRAARCWCWPRLASWCGGGAGREAVLTRESGRPYV
jgi:hypothetical protein